MKTFVFGALLLQTLDAQVLDSTALVASEAATVAPPLAPTDFVAPPDLPSAATPSSSDIDAAGLLNVGLGGLISASLPDLGILPSIGLLNSLSADIGLLADTTTDTGGITAAADETTTDTTTTTETGSETTTETSTETTTTGTDTTTTDSTTDSTTTSTTTDTTTTTESLATNTADPDYLSSPWSGEDTGDYDGQDYGEDDHDYEEECPYYCKKHGDYGHGGYKDDGYKDDGYEGDDYSDDADYEDDSSYSMKKLLLKFIRRAAPSSDGGFGSFMWPKGSKHEDECSDDVPEWLYKSSEPKCKPKKCPKSCYKHYPSKDYGHDEPYPTKDYGHKDPYPTKDYGHEDPYPTKDDYTTKKPYETHYETPYETPYESTEPYEDPYTSEDPYGHDTTTEHYPKETSSGEDPWGSNSTTSEEPWPTDDSSTSTSTQTTFVTSTLTNPGWDDSMPEASEIQPGAEAAWAPAPTAGGSGDWTGESLATVCPKQCNPFDPAVNKCDITSSCTTTGKGKYYCACRAGFRASAWNAKDFSKQFKFEGQPYVYTAQGVACDTVCADQTCTEVLTRPHCQ